MESEIFNSLRDLPFAVLFAWFLWLSFKQRKETMHMMTEITGQMMKTISDCCDEEDDNHKEDL